jgi:hypothetical protein
MVTVDADAFAWIRPWLVRFVVVPPMLKLGPTVQLELLAAEIITFGPKVAVCVPSREAMLPLDIVKLTLSSDD